MENQPEAQEPGVSEAAAAVTQVVPATVRTMRREPCPCGSGKKFKNCHEGQPGYEVAVVSTPEVPTPPAGTVSPPGRDTTKHFPGKESKNIASQPGFRAYFRKRG